MTHDTYLLKGKYAGSTFEEILAKDVNYCNFIVSLKFVSEGLREFKEWLIINIKQANDKKLNEEIAKVAKRHNM